MSDAPEALTGGCQCGAVRFRATGPFKVSLCHCRMCQKAFGNYFAPLVTAKAVEWTRGTPALFRSSNMARRGFCSACGTPLFYLGVAVILGAVFLDPLLARRSAPTTAAEPEVQHPEVLGTSEAKQMVD